MTVGNKVSAVICAGGKGTRAGFSQNKLLKNVLGIPVLERTLAALSLPEIDEIVVAAARDDWNEIVLLCKKYGAKIAEGGETRFFSVFNALKAASGDIVLMIGQQITQLNGVTDGVVIDVPGGMILNPDGEPIENGLDGDMPVIEPGWNAVSWTGSVTSVKITYNERSIGC